MVVGSFKAAYAHTNEVAKLFFYSSIAFMAFSRSNLALLVCVP